MRYFTWKFKRSASPFNVKATVGRRSNKFLRSHTNHIPAEWRSRVGRRGFEPLKHKCSRFQVPPGYPEAWTISSPWLLALGGRRLVSARSPADLLRKSKRGGFAQDSPHTNCIINMPKIPIGVGASLNSPTFPSRISSERCFKQSVPFGHLGTCP